MYTTDNDHAAEFQMHHGRHKLDEKQPVIGSWIHYGLGTLNENLPQFVFLGQYKDPRVKRELLRRLPRARSTRASSSRSTRATRCRSARGPRTSRPRSRSSEFEFIRDLNRLSAVEYPEDDQLRARIKAYELAFRMQDSVPEVARPGRRDGRDPAALRHRPGGHGRLRPPAARRAPAGRARGAVHPGLPQRLRRVGLAHPAQGPARPVVRPGRPADRRPAQGPQAARPDRRRHGRLLHRVRPHAGPGDRDGTIASADRPRPPPARLHVWFAGAGIKGGTVHGATDELGFHAVEHPHYVTDVHATVLHLLGLDPRRLDVPGRKRLEIDYGRPIREIMA